MTTRRTRGRTFCWLLLPLAGAALAQDDAGAHAGQEKARVTVSMLVTSPKGATRREMQYGPFDLAAGESLHSVTFAVEGRSAVEEASEQCVNQMSMSAPQTVLPDHAFVWRVSVGVLAASTDQIVLGTTWERLTRGDDGQPRTLAGGAEEERLTLKEGDRLLLDYADRAPGGDLRCARNYAVELTAGMAEDTALARRQIGYELWLVHEEPGGNRTSHYAKLTAAQGGETAFQFPHESIPADPAAVPGASSAELEVDVSGTVRGRIRPDGTLDLSLGTHRQLWYEAADGSGGVTGDGGDKFLNLEPDETFRVDLPAAPSIEDPERYARYARDLEGHSFAVILRAKPLP